MNLSEAFAAARAAAVAPEHDFKIGQQVHILNRDYRGEEGKIIAFDTNMLGAPIVDVLIEPGRVLGFYPRELELKETDNVS